MNSSRSGGDADHCIVLVVDGVVEHLDAVAGSVGNALLGGGTTPEGMGNLFSGVFFRNLLPEFGFGIK